MKIIWENEYEREDTIRIVAKLYNKIYEAVADFNQEKMFESLEVYDAIICSFLFLENE